jgi:hypothetical protein
MIFARPCNRSEAKRIDTSKCGLSIIDRTKPIRVSEYHKMRSARRVLNAKIDSTLSVPHNSLCCIPVNHEDIEGIERQVLLQKRGEDVYESNTTNYQLVVETMKD